MQQPGNEGIPQVLDARTEIKNLLMETREEMRSMARSMLEDFSTELHGNIQQNAPVVLHPPGPPMPRQQPDPRHTEGLSINPSFHSEHGHITESPESQFAGTQPTTPQRISVLITPITIHARQLNIISSSHHLQGKNAGISGITDSQMLLD